MSWMEAQAPNRLDRPNRFGSSYYSGLDIIEWAEAKWTHERPATYIYTTIKLKPQFAFGTRVFCGAALLPCQISQLVPYRGDSGFLSFSSYFSINLLFLCVYLLSVLTFPFFDCKYWIHGFQLASNRMFTGCLLPRLLIYNCQKSEVNILQHSHFEKFPIWIFLSFDYLIVKIGVDLYYIFTLHITAFGGKWQSAPLF